MPSPFGQLLVHPRTPPSHAYHATILRYLERLALDPAVVHVCRLHNYHVGALSELLPHEHPHLLGLNENKGERILLRIRTDDADGMRDYKTSRRVLMHELAHNEVRGAADQISEHPPAFKTLNSQLNAEVDAYERDVQRGTHRLHDAPTYEPVSTSVGTQGGTYTLGGRGTTTSSASESPTQRRDRVLHATETRLAQLDAEIRQHCGDTSDATSTRPSM